MSRVTTRVILLMLAALAANNDESWVSAADTDEADAVQHVFYLHAEQLIPIAIQVRIDGVPLRQVWNKSLDKRFDAFDKDGDGQLSHEESRHMPTKDTLLRFGITVIRDDVQLDSRPRDGKVTRREFRDYFERLGIHPFGLIANGTVNPEQQRLLAARNRAPANLHKLLFEKLDTSGDGKLSEEELTVASHALRKLDLDSDEAISSAELAPMVQQFYQALEPPSRTSNTPTLFITVPNSQTARATVPRIMSIYDSRDGVAEKNDNQLSREEIGWEEESFKSVDADGNGALDFEEMQQMLLNPPATITVSIKLGELADGERPLALARKQTDREDDSQDSVTVGRSQFQFVAGSEVAADSAASIAANLLRAVDADNNGYLEPNEAMRFGVADAQFSSVDDDNDRKLFPNEIAAFIESLLTFTRGRVQLQIVDRGQDLFRMLDTDRDSRLSPREFQTARSRLPQWDQDGDGFVAIEELLHQYQFSVEPVSINAFGGIAGQGRRGPYAGISGQMQSPRVTWHSKMDRNGDGDITQREFLGPREVFEQLDADKDGLLSVIEAEAAK
ncbi:MAG: hypothetical protein KDA62_03675 [Planctomycetales bacterium]|nr:hypothetical protein [Planctomycetales bacterium]